ncbi:MAG: nucleotidyltransferase family protein [Rhodocyclales bacterium]|nr:nucleotidyltransferase family protein [Rhodocyclales bacterium]
MWTERGPTGGIVGILLAAGVGRRFGGRDKLMHRLADGTPLAVAAAVNLRPACSRVVAVLRPDRVPLADALASAGCEIVLCPDADRGMGHSLATGVRAAADADGWLVALGDMPGVDSSSHRAVTACLKAGASLAATQYGIQRGHPVGFAREWFAELSTLTGDQGGRTILEQHPQQLVLCPVDDPGVLLDIDRRADLVDIYPLAVV